ncbi:MAG: mechanosensitive ion channel [Bacteroidetes bacterium]|nr:mechanosensitive ion channel [Bacteroidota bacterium]MBU1718250.1 mechanosensitive ion channel [Bacteroidota bacterium]
MEKSIGEYVLQWLNNLGLEGDTSIYVKNAIMLVGLAILALIVNFIAKQIILTILHRIAKKTKSNWDDILFERKVFHKLSHLAPAIVLYALGPIVLDIYPVWALVLVQASKIYMIVIFVITLVAFFNALNVIYNQYEIAKNKPIKGFVQIANILIYFIGGILVISILLGQSPAYLLGGLGALTAVLLLVFKDTILGFVGSIQLSANDMLRPGDWVEIPQYGADGIVMEITLTVVKVQNWDKTISNVPTYSLITNAFKNWRGMEESGGRRIMRTIFLNVNSVKFCDEAMIEKFSKIALIRDYVLGKQKELYQLNEQDPADTSISANGRNQTNIGVFRKYIYNYLHENPLINKDMTFLVRLLESGATGVGIQVYVFSKIQAWVEYEEVQGDIFDHLLAIVPEFGLQIYQNPTGADFVKAIK